MMPPRRSDPFKGALANALAIIIIVLALAEAGVFCRHG